MRGIKIFSIFVGLVLMQTVFSKPVENTSNSVESSEESDSAKTVLLLFTATNFLLIASKYAEKSVKIAGKMMKDEDLLANEKPEVMEFKKNMTTFLEAYEATNDLEKIFEVLETFSNATDHYLELPKEKETPESMFIVEVLNKYKVKEMEQKLLKDFDEFVVQFKTLFEAAKKEMNKPMLDWYDKFIKLDDFEKKFEAFGDFAELV
ncbi:uncharacterized protein ACRADG_004353 [Cochliomyia hominivorax]